MKKVAYIVFGVIIGIGVTISGDALADTAKSLIGKTIKSEMVVYVDGVKLNEAAPVIEGKTQLPVRKMAEIAGMELELKGNQVYLTTKKIEECAITGAVTPLTPAEWMALKNELDFAKEYVKFIQEEITKIGSTSVNTAEEAQQVSVQIQFYGNLLSEYNAKIIELQMKLGVTQ